VVKTIINHPHHHKWVVAIKNGVVYGIVLPTWFNFPTVLSFWSSLYPMAMGHDGAENEERMLSRPVMATSKSSQDPNRWGKNSTF